MPIRTLPHAHGDHFHIGRTVLAGRDAMGLRNPNVLSALARKGLLRGGRAGPPILTAEGLAFEIGIAAEILHGAEQWELPPGLSAHARLRRTG